MPSLARRSLVTLAVVAGLFVLRRVPLPGIASGSFEGGYLFSVGALGIMSWVSATVILEWGTLLRGRRRRMRVGTPAERARIDRFRPALWLVVSGLHAFAMALTLEQMVGVAFSPGWGFRALFTLTVVAGCAVTVIGARIIDGHGLGGGTAVLLLATTAPTLVAHSNLGALVHEASRAVLAPLVAALLLGGFATHRLWRRWTRAPALPLAAAGIGPVTMAGVVVGLPALAGQPAPSAMLALPVATALAYALGFLFHLPWNVAPLAGCTEKDVLRALKWPLALSALWAAGLAALQPTMAGCFLAPVTLDMAALATAGCLAWDLAAEGAARARLGELTAVWPLHRVYAVPVALDALQEAGIPAMTQDSASRQESGLEPTVIFQGATKRPGAPIGRGGGGAPAVRGRASPPRQKREAVAVVRPNGRNEDHGRDPRLRPRPALSPGHALLRRVRPHRNPRADRAGSGGLQGARAALLCGAGQVHSGGADPLAARVRCASPKGQASRSAPTSKVIPLFLPHVALGSPRGKP